MKHRASELQLRTQLEQATSKLEIQPDCALRQERHSSLRSSLQQFETRKLEGIRLRSKIRWNMKGDRVTKEFFRGVKEKAASSTITSLRGLDGARITDQAGLREFCHDFYRDLYAVGPHTEAHEAAM
jgi:hypothetical protein